MKLKVLFIANTVVSVPFGIGSVLAPHLFLSLFGATLGPAGAVMMQYGGAWLVGLGLLTWLTRSATESEAGQGVTWALLVAYCVAFVVSLRGQLAGALNALDWMPVAIQAFFAAGLGYHLLAGRRAVAARVQQA
jgi:cytosine/uracil/thiamine/allantoin permease